MQFPTGANWPHLLQQMSVVYFPIICFMDIVGITQQFCAPPACPYTAGIVYMPGRCYCILCVAYMLVYKLHIYV